MPLSTNRQAQIAFKNLVGKSQAQKNFGPGDELNGYFINISTNNVWSTPIPSNDPTKAVNDGVAIKVLLDLKPINESTTDGKPASFLTTWGQTSSNVILSTTKDPITNNFFTYGAGLLKDVAFGNIVYDLIPDSYGYFYALKPYTNYPSGEIFAGDINDWVFQYSSGVLYQDNNSFSSYQTPTKAVGYYYIGNKLSSLDSGKPSIIRVSATGPDNQSTYFATGSSVRPSISTYSITNLYLIDFFQGNTSSVKLNINNIGTYSVLKYGLTGLSELSSGDIIGATGATSGQTYYLTYDNDGYFLFNSSNPQSTPGNYKNTNSVVNNVGGVEKGTEFNDVRFQDVFDDLFYPDQLAQFTSISLAHPTLFTSSVPTTYLIDLGRPILGSITFSWDYSKGTNFLTNSVVVEDVTQITTPTSNWPAPFKANGPYKLENKIGGLTYSSNLFSNVIDRRIYQISSDRVNNTKIKKFAEIQWTNRVYFGSTTSDTMTPFGVTSMSSILSTQSTGTYLLSGTQGYKYIAVPNTQDYSFTNILYFNIPLTLATQGYSLVDNGNNYTTMTVTNSYNIGTTYRIYRTLNEISGTFSVNITK